MKKIILSFCAVALFTLVSCDDGNNGKIHYLDNKLIEGTWIGVTPSVDGSYTIDSAVYIFKNNEATSRFYAHINGLDTLKLEEDVYLGTYQITDSTIFYSVHSERNQRYEFRKNNRDSLFLQHPVDTAYWEGLKRLKE